MQDTLGHGNETMIKIKKLQANGNEAWLDNEAHKLQIQTTNQYNNTS